MTPKEKQRYILRYGKLVLSDGQWTWTAAPDFNFDVSTVSTASRWDTVEITYDYLKEQKKR
jgi:hypothetical protein